MGISVIIPVAEGDESWKELLPDLKALAADDEIILCSKKSIRDQLSLEAGRNGLICGVHWAPSNIGRGMQLNTGARWAKSDFFWFLHCDSRVKGAAISELKKSLQTKPAAIHYFNLKFMKDGPWMTAANGCGVRLRSRVLRLPFGDQGYCMHRGIYRDLGGFCENATYGEDHLFIWKAHRGGVKLSCVDAPLYTSARRYKSDGWFTTTSRHLALTVRQAAPEFWQLVKEKTRL